MSASYRRPAPGETTERRRDQGFSPPPGRRDPHHLAAGGDPLRADSHYACPEVLDWCEANGLDYILGLAPTSTLKRHVGGLEASTSARFKADPTAGKVRRFKEFHDAAGSWSRVRRIVARVEAGGDGTDTASIVTNLGHGNGRSLYQDLYCRRGQAENHIKAWKSHLAADRTSCPKATANEFRPVPARRRLLAAVEPARADARASSWRVAQFDTLRLRLVKIAARVVEMKTKIKIHLPTSAPDQSIFRLVSAACRVSSPDRRGSCPAITRAHQPPTPSAPLSPNAADRGQSRLASTLHSGALTGLGFCSRGR